MQHSPPLTRGEIFYLSRGHGGLEACLQRGENPFLPSHYHKSLYLPTFGHSLILYFRTRVPLTQPAPPMWRRPRRNTRRSPTSCAPSPTTAKEHTGSTWTKSPLLSNSFGLICQSHVSSNSLVAAKGYYISPVDLRHVGLFATLRYWWSI